MSFEQRRNPDGRFGEKLGSAPIVELETDAPVAERPLMPTITRPWNEPQARAAAQKKAEEESAEEQQRTATNKVASTWNRLFGTGR